MARRQKKQHAHVDERWLLTYADVITLLFALFIVLFSISVVNQSKFEALKATLAGAFDVGILDGGSAVLPETRADTPAPIVESVPNVLDASSPLASVGVSNPNSTPAQTVESQQLEEVKRKIEEEAAQAGFKGKITATVNEKGLAIKILTDGVLFDSGSAVLRPEGIALLRPVGVPLRELQNRITIDGHTDSDPISSAQFPSNRHLSSFRALAVETYMMSLGIADPRMEAVGHGDTRPVKSNDTAANKQQNRRVEMLVLREQGSPGSPLATPPGG
jgi:chemotaxis protein MotB